SNLSPDTYRVEIVDNPIGCTADSTFVILGSPSLMTVATGTSTGVDPTYNIDCNGGRGYIDITPSGGTPPYTVFGPFSSHVLTSSTTQRLSNLQAFAWNYRVTDALGCEVTGNITLTEPPTAVSLTVDGTTVSTACTNVGTISTTATGGTGPYTYTLGDTSNSTGDFINLAAGTYLITATDIWGCTDQVTQEVTAPGQLMLSFVETEVSCADTMDGALQVTIMGGIPEYFFELIDSTGTIVATHTTSGNTTHTFANIAGNDYTVRVTDADGCMTQAAYTVFEPAPLILLSTDVIQRPCHDDDPEIFLEIQGRASGFLDEFTMFVSFDGGPFSSLAREVDGADNGVAELYEVYQGFPNAATSVAILDERGCQAITNPSSIFVEAPPQELQLQLVSTTQTSCFNGEDGTITMQVIGGRPPYRLRLVSVNGLLITSDLETKENSSGLFTFAGLAPAIDGSDLIGYDFFLTDNIDGPEDERCSLAWFNEGSGSGGGPIEVGQPVPISATVAVDPAGHNCAFDNGIVTVTAMGGTSPYEYSSDSVNWQTSPILTDLGVNPNVYVRDANFCGYVYPNPITIPVAPIPLEVSEEYVIESPSECAPAVDSFVLANVELPFEVELVEVNYIEMNVVDVVAPKVDINLVGNSFVTINNFRDYDNYNSGDSFELVYRISDTAQCEILHTVNFTLASRISIEPLGTTGETCLDSSDGSLQAVTTGGSSPYTYQLNLADDQIANEGQPVIYSNLTSGNYLLTVRDDRGCLASVVDSVEVASPITPLVTTTAAGLCANDSIGAITLSLTGGTAPYTVQWLDNFDLPFGSPVTVGAGQSTTLNNLGSADQNVLISDATGCTIRPTYRIEGPTSIEFNPISLVDPSCSGNDGEITFQVLGGTGTLLSSIDGGAFSTDTTYTGLLGGPHDISILDDNGCTFDTTINLIGTSVINLGVAVENVACPGGNTASITVTPNGGTPGYTYSLNGGTFQVSNTFSGLGGGTYTITVMDADGCMVDATDIEVTEPADLIVSPIIVALPSCEVTGTITAVVVGGTPPYTYDWNNGLSTNDTLFNAIAGSYTLVVTDANNCMESISIDLPGPTPPVLNLISQVDEACDMADGSLTVSATNGTPPYSYVIGLDTNTTGVFNGLIAGSYEIEVIDNGLCMDTITVDILAVAGPSLSEQSITASACNAPTGSATVSVTNGTAPLVYSWSHNVGLDNATATGLAPGSYSVTVTDARNCVDSLTLVIPEADPPIATVNQVIDANCGQNNGSATIGVIGGTPAYSFEWSHSNTVVGPSANELAPDNYSVTVTDQNGCTDTISFVITDLPGPELQVIEIIDANCDLSNGSIEVGPVVNSSTYLYTWSHSASVIGPIADNLPAGTYSVTITDVDGCQDSLLNLVVNSTESPTLSLLSSTENTCTEGNAEIVLATSGGTAPYNYAWSHDGILNDSIATGLVAGSYSVTVTDAGNCTDQLTLTITDGLIFAINDVLTTQPGCGLSNGSITLDIIGGVTPYSYVWDHDGALNALTASDLSAGNYPVTITDNAGCVLTTSITLEDPDGPEANVLASENSTCGLANGSATLGVSQGTYPYQYTWSHDGTLTDSIATNLPAGNYTITITDAQSCTDLVSFIITSTPEAEIILISSVDETCTGANGSIIVGPNTGTPG
ncbi:MAG: SprB repeat-containing protein, partial [Bacteroidota bacterium]